MWLEMKIIYKYDKDNVDAYVLTEYDNRCPRFVR